jgi:hypothetical protein
MFALTIENNFSSRDQGRRWQQGWWCMLADCFRWRKTERGALLACFLGEGKRKGAAGGLTCLGKRKEITAACLLLLDGRKEETQNYVGGLLVQIMAGKRLLVVEEEQKKKIVGCCSLLDQREKH